MDFDRNHNDVNNVINSTIQHCKLENAMDTISSSTTISTTTTTTSSGSETCQTDEVNVLTNCKRCNSKGANFYLGQDISPRAKLLKAIVIVLATICTAYVCILSSRRYFYTWVQTVIERTDVHVSEIPFPAITICPVRGLNLVRLKTEAMTFTTPDNNLQQFHLLLHSLNDLLWSPMYDNDDDDDNTMAGANGGSGNETSIEEFLEQLEKTQTFEAITLNHLMYFLSFECEDLFEECTWRRQRVSCCTIFRKINTYRGVCYAFNSLNVEDPISSWPWVVSDSGLQTGLRVHVKRGSIKNYYERVVTMVHDPKEISTSDVHYLSGQRVVITINPLRFTADYDIHSVSPDERHCYFTSELKLLGKSQSNCMRDCRMRYIERNCNCTYLFPVATRSPNGQQNLPICPLLSTGNILEENIDDVEFNTFNCKCYPNCNYIQYGTLVSTDYTVETTTRDYIDLQVQYQHDTLFSYRSTLCFNLLDLIVSYGGIAGLFLGLSLVGIIDLLHDFIVCWKLRVHVKEDTSSSKE